MNLMVGRHTILSITGHFLLPGALGGYGVGRGRVSTQERVLDSRDSQKEMALVIAGI